MCSLTIRNRGPSATGSVQPAPSAHHGVTLREAILVWARIALLSFGGPAGQIAVMHRILVDEKRWIGETRFLHALNYCMLLPGPEAQQLAVYIGWLMHRTLGGVIAGTLFVLPGVVAIMALSWIYVLFGNLTVVSGMFFGLKTAVLAIVIQAVVRVGRRAIKNRVLLMVAAAAFVAIFAFDVPFPAIILSCGLIGLVRGALGRPEFLVGGTHGPTDTELRSDAGSLLGDGTPAHTRPTIAWSATVAATCLFLWFAPTAALLLTAGEPHVFTQIALFFSKTAVVTFGGAYAVLAYVAQEAVETYGWLKPGEMLDGLGMAETTPGPLIMVTQFVGFLAAYRDPGALPPLLAATLGGLLTTWVTFVPSFLWILLGAPFVEILRRNLAVAGALAAITAAVVGVILNLAIWFGMHVIFRELEPIDVAWLSLERPVLRSIDVPSLLLTVSALLAIFRFKVGIVATLAGCALAGMLWFMARTAV
jgi:chromate transporter